MDESIQEVWDEMKTRTWVLDVADVVEYEEWCLTMLYAEESRILWYFTYGDLDWTDSGDEDVPVYLEDVKGREDELLKSIEAERFHIERVDSDCAIGVDFEFRDSADIIAFVKHHGIKIKVKAKKKTKRMMNVVRDVDTIIAALGGDNVD